ncbi:hypothetical protein ACWDZ4_33010 [Streptomyces sp. NPDC003016]
MDAVRPQLAVYVPTVATSRSRVPEAVLDAGHEVPHLARLLGGLPAARFGHDEPLPGIGERSSA